MITGVLHIAGITIFWGRMPASYYLIGIMLQFFLTVGVRFSYRFVLLERNRREKSEREERSKNVMIIGAGEAGRTIVRELQNAKETNSRVRCLIDDNPNKWGRYMEGVPVVGGRDDIFLNVDKYHINQILLAIPTATPHQKLVVEKGLDVGFAYDGDADRCLCVDEKGNVVSGDAILYVYGRYMKERGKLLTNTVVTTVMSNFGLYKAFDALDIDYAKTAVGDKYVYEYMMQNGCRIGGEQSGHIIFSKYASTGDGILTSLKMMEVIMARKKKLSELTADLAIYPQVLENVRVHDKAAAQADVDVQAAVESVAEALGDTGRILVRESGTEPLLRVMVEAESEELCRKYVDQVVEIVRKKGHVAE